MSFTVVGVVRGFAPEGLGTEGGRLQMLWVPAAQAPGAPPRAMVAWLGATALRVSLAGIFLGLPAATLLMGARGSLSPTADLALLMALAGGMALLALASAVWPAWRAGRVDPAGVLYR